MPTDRRTQQLAHAYQQLAAGLRRQLLTSPHDLGTYVDDGLSFAWIRAYELDHVDLRDLNRLRGWLYTTARHEMLRLDRDARLTVSDGLTPPRQSDAPSPERQVIARQDLAEFAATAKPREVQALGLQALGYSYVEIAQLLGCTTRAVDRLLVRGRRRARKADD